MSAAPVLHIQRDGEDLRSVPLEGESVLGRGEDCVIRLEDRAISRQHAVLRPIADGIQVERKSEFAPVSVNGNEITRAILKPGDVIEIGPYLMRVSIPEKMSAGPLSASGQLPSPTDPTVPLVAAAPAAPQEAAPLVPSEPLIASPAPTASLEALPAEMPAFGDSALALEPAPAEALAAPEGTGPGLADPLGELGDPLSGLEAAPVEAVSTNATAPIDPDADLGTGEVLGLPLDEAAASAAAQPQQAMEIAEDDAATKVGISEMVQVRLIFKAGEANTTVYEINKEEVSIGRGKSCDVIIADKKSSRKNAIIRKAGLQFVIKDLSSANGTYVNGARIEEMELTGNDVIRIGDTEFEFRAGARDYTEAEKDFLQVPASELQEAPGDLQFGGAAALDANGALPQIASTIPNPMGASVSSPVEAVPAFTPAPATTPFTPPPGPEIAGIAGIGNPGAQGKGGFMEKFRALPKGRQYMVIVMVITLLYFFLFDEEEEQVQTKPRPRPSVTASLGSKTAVRRFESLTPEQQRFVESQHAMAFEYYKNKDYDKALFEIRKIFSLVEEYKDSKEIERYALEGKRKREQIEEERRRKDEETRLKQRVLELENETRSLMAKRRYEQAREFFAQILALDPENAAVERWRAEIEEYEESKRLEGKRTAAMKEINQQAWEVYRQGLGLQKKGRYHSAIAIFDKVKDIGATDPRIARLAARQIAKTRALIRDAREPVLAQAREAEQGGDHAKAYQFFKRATVIDPPHPEGYAGMKRVRDVLHERAKYAYTEAVLFESYSDFDAAKKKYQDIIATTPVDDVYYQRAQRKLARYFHRSGDPIE